MADKKYIKDLPLKQELDGTESVLIQDNESTKQASLEAITNDVKQTSAARILEMETELAVERKRINKLTSLGEGSTTGDAELLDMRIGADGRTYDTSGDALRRQVKRLNDHVLPSYYLDFKRRVDEYEASHYTRKIFQATEDSLRVIENEVTTGNGGFNIKLNRAITKIEFDLEELNFGVNLGLGYYNANGLLMKLYKAYAAPLSETKTNHKISFELDWNVIQSSIDTNGYAELRFLVFNQTGSKIGGYNYLTNIRVNNYRNSEKLNDAVTEIENELPDLIHRGQVTVGDIINEPYLIDDISTVYPWNEGEMKYDGNQLTFSHHTSGNTGFRTKNFRVTKYSCIHVSGTVTSISGTLGVSISYVIKETGKRDYKTFGTLTDAVQFNYDISINDIIKSKGEIVLDTVYVVLSNAVENLDTTLSKLVITTKNSLFEEKSLEDILNYEIKDNISFANVKNVKRMLGTPEVLAKWNASKLETSYEDGILNVAHPQSGGNSGLITLPFTSETNFIVISGNIVAFSDTSSNGNAKYVINVAGKAVSTGSTTYITVYVLPRKTGPFKTVIDLNFYAVYHDLDLSKPVQILLGNSYGPVSISISDYKIYEGALVQTTYAGDTLLDSFINVDNALVSLNSKVSAIETSDSANILTSPNGTKYILQVSNNGIITCVPKIPNKVLFIGNSLLFGFSTFGMCASDSKHDYYYYVTQYLKQFHPDGTYDKLLGSTYEMCETKKAAKDWIENNIDTRTTDYDLVIVQLGDNINNDARNELFKTSCKDLLVGIRNHMPNARVVWAGEWYSRAERQEIIATSCSETGSTFIDISDLAVIQANKGAIGNVITRDDGTTFVVDNSGVASHPGDKGMKAIADRMIEKLFK